MDTTSAVCMAFSMSNYLVGLNVESSTSDFIQNQLVNFGDPLELLVIGP